MEAELREDLAKVEQNVESISKSLEESERRNSELVSQSIAARKQASIELEVLYPPLFSTLYFSFGFTPSSSHTL